MRQKLRHELEVIERLQREWNALSAAERMWIATLSPDLSLFFRRGLARQDRNHVPRAQTIDPRRKTPLSPGDGRRSAIAGRF
jgi:hypothetical protein